jgi:hypothetical protein
MKRLLAFLALLTVPAAQAQNPTSVGSVLPPIEYDQPYQGQLAILRGDKARMDGLCPKTPRESWEKALQRRRPDRQILW